MEKKRPRPPVWPGNQSSGSGGPSCRRPVRRRDARFRRGKFLQVRLAFSLHPSCSWCSPCGRPVHQPPRSFVNSPCLLRRRRREAPPRRVAVAGAGCCCFAATARRRGEGGGRVRESVRVGGERHKRGGDGFGDGSGDRSGQRQRPELICTEHKTSSVCAFCFLCFPSASTLLRTASQPKSLRHAHSRTQAHEQQHRSNARSDTTPSGTALRTLPHRQQPQTAQTPAVVRPAALRHLCSTRPTLL